jgi:hypothetical protein
MGHSQAHPTLLLLLLLLATAAARSGASCHC